MEHYQQYFGVYERARDYPRRWKSGWLHGLRRYCSVHLEIIYEINRCLLDAVRTRFPGDEGRIERVSLIEEGPVSRSAWQTWQSLVFAQHERGG